MAGAEAACPSQEMVALLTGEAATAMAAEVAVTAEAAIAMAAGAVVKVVVKTVGVVFVLAEEVLVEFLFEVLLLPDLAHLLPVWELFQ